MTARRTLNLAHGELHTPVFLPDATLAVVRSLDAADLENVGVDALVMNVFHLMQKPGSSAIQALGGLHAMSGWRRPIVTDSGGFQAYSLIRRSPRLGRISDQGLRFKPEGADREYQLSPEKSVQLQLAYGADIVICLDDCTHADAASSEQDLSVERTLRWAKRCKAEFTTQMERRRLGPDDPRPLLFAVVQGGGDAERRKRCAESLLEIGFDGYGYGGWPLDSDGHLLTDMLAATREAIPDEFPMHALGIGQPESVTECARMGYSLFDCALPTRDARTGRLYVWTSDPDSPTFRLDGRWRDTLYIDDEKHIRNAGPISPGCDCPTCRRYTVGYLRHLHKSGETLYFRLATLHNLRFMTRLMARLRSDAASPGGTPDEGAGDGGG